jgi:DNA-binding CsgD family transcriptional regulator
MSRLSELTDRERDVMLLAIQGYPNKEIARTLGISHRTVEIHKSKIMHKTGATNLLDLARIAHEGISDS